MIVRTTLAAIEKAATDYVLFSGGWSSWAAPEYFYTTCIAQRIGRLRNAPSVTLEYPIYDAMEAAGCPRNENWGDRKFDIVLWDHESPIAPIEVKRVDDLGQNEIDDVQRICGALNENDNNNSLQYGMLAHLVSGQATENNGQITFGHLKGKKGRERIRRSRNKIRQCVDKHGEDLRVTSHVRCILPDDYGREFAAIVHRISRLHLA